MMSGDVREGGEPQEDGAPANAAADAPPVAAAATAASVATAATAATAEWLLPLDGLYTRQRTKVVPDRNKALVERTVMEKKVTKYQVQCSSTTRPISALMVPAGLRLRPDADQALRAVLVELADTAGRTAVVGADVFQAYCVRRFEATPESDAARDPFVRRVQVRAPRGTTGPRPSPGPGRPARSVLKHFDGVGRTHVDGHTI